MSPKPETWSDIYLSVREHLAQAVSRIVPPRDIEDIVQETYVRLCQVEKKEEIRSPRSFLFKIARNLALDSVKRAEARLAVSMQDDEEWELAGSGELHDETYAQAVSDEEFALFCKAIRHLPAQCRRSFILKKVYGCSQREICRELDLSENTVEKQIALGMKRCTYFMKQQTGGKPMARRRSPPGQPDAKALP